MVENHVRQHEAAKISIHTTFEMLRGQGVLRDLVDLGTHLIGVLRDLGTRLTSQWYKWHKHPTKLMRTSLGYKNWFN